MASNTASVGNRGRAVNGDGFAVAPMVEDIVGCKWSVRLLQLCEEGRRRPGQFLRACPGLSPKVMNERWRKMLRFGIVRRSVAGDKPPLMVEYRLTPFGRRFVRILEEVRKLQEAVDLGSVRPRPTRATFDHVNRQDVRRSRRER